MSFSPSAPPRVVAKSLVLVCLASLAACGGEPGTLFTASGVNDGGAGGASGNGGALHAAGAGGRGASTAGAPARGDGGAPARGDGGAPAHGDGGAPAHAAGSTGMPPDPPGPMPGSTDGGGMHSACDGKMTEPTALIADFEHGVPGWSSYIGNSGNTLFGGVTNTQPGAETTAFAASFVGGKAETSGMFHTQYCSDVSKFDGISFWAKGGDGAPVRFLAVIPATDPTSGFIVCNRHAIQACALLYPHDYPEPESIVLLHRAGIRMREMPVTMQMTIMSSTTMTPSLTAERQNITTATAASMTRSSAGFPLVDECASESMVVPR